MRGIKEALKQLAVICNEYSVSGNFNTVNDWTMHFQPTYLVPQMLITYIKITIRKN